MEGGDLQVVQHDVVGRIAADPDHLQVAGRRRRGRLIVRPGQGDRQTERDLIVATHGNSASNLNAVNIRTIC